MTEEFRVPKRKISVHIHVVGHEERATNVFLASVAEGRSRPEKPSDLLNGHGAFLPTVDDDGTFSIVQKKFLLYLTCASEEELGGDDLTPEDLAAEDATQMDLDVDLSNGLTLTGTVIYLLPRANRRLLDYLRVADDFFVLREKEKVHLVNKNQVATFRQLKES